MQVGRRINQVKAEAGLVGRHQRPSFRDRCAIQEESRKKLQEGAPSKTNTWIRKIN